MMDRKQLSPIDIYYGNSPYVKSRILQNDKILLRTPQIKSNPISITNPKSIIIPIIKRN